ncbi:biotin carboxylase N-terminal domain-containing protein [Aeromicrobium sp. UC242_57]|uniref:biotin carboxylase N-terminal domain-containing protein n=1 Tax=Aeromicrobium sp. UC242_57 TaxID=3374624 RepID=UPI0037917206
MTFSSVLVANRGEIARRVILACREAGLRSVAVYSDADADAPYVQLADDAVHIGPTSAAESYLSIDRILLAAKAKGAEAIHPGYGFLSRASRVRPGGRRRRTRVHRTHGRRHGRDGPQGSRPDDRREGRRPGHSAVRRCCGAGGRLPRAGQGGGRRRRQGHADRA